MNLLKRIFKRKAAKVAIALLAALLPSWLGISEESANEIAAALMGLL